MKKNLLPGFIAIFILFLFSCSNKNYTASNFEEKTVNHKVVAILPAEVTFTGKLPKTLSPDAIAKAEERESIDFQYALMNSILNCLLYTSDAADERSSVDLGGRRI